MKKKVVVVMLATLMSAMCMIGCGNKALESGNSTQAEGKQTEVYEDKEKVSENTDQEAADQVAALIDAIYVQQRTDETDKQCEEAKEAWDALTDEQKKLVEGENADYDYFGRYGGCIKG